MEKQSGPSMVVYETLKVNPPLKIKRYHNLIDLYLPSYRFGFEFFDVRDKVYSKLSRSCDWANRFNVGKMIGMINSGLCSSFCIRTERKDNPHKSSCPFFMAPEWNRGVTDPPPSETELCRCIREFVESFPPDEFRFCVMEACHKSEWQGTLGWNARAAHRNGRMLFSPTAFNSGGLVGEVCVIPNKTHRELISGGGALNNPQNTFTVEKWKDPKWRHSVYRFFKYSAPWNRMFEVGGLPNGRLIFWDESESKVEYFD